MGVILKLNEKKINLVTGIFSTHRSNSHPNLTNTFHLIACFSIGHVAHDPKTLNWILKPHHALDVMSCV